MTCARLFDVIYIMKFLYVMLFASLLQFFSSCNSTNSKRKSHPITTSGKFKVGQVWKYHNRDGEDASTFTILKIEIYNVTKDTIIHIRIDNVKMYSSNGHTETVEHLPCSAASVSQSSREMIGIKTQVPDFAEGYASWKKAWDEGKGGYLTAELKDVIDGLDQGMRKER